MPQWLSISEAGRATGRKRQHLQQLLKAGRIPEEFIRREGDRTYLRLEGLREELEAILRPRSDSRFLKAAGREELAPWPSDREAVKRQIASADEGGLPSISLSERRIRALKSALLQVELQEKRNELVAVAEVRRGADAAARTVRARLEVIADQITPEVISAAVGGNAFHEVHRLISGAIEEALRGLSSRESAPA